MHATHLASFPLLFGFPGLPLRVELAPLRDRRFDHADILVRLAEPREVVLEHKRDRVHPR